MPFIDRAADWCGLRCGNCRGLIVLRSSKDLGIQGCLDCGTENSRRLTKVCRLYSIAHKFCRPCSCAPLRVFFVKNSAHQALVYGENLKKDVFEENDRTIFSHSLLTAFKRSTSVDLRSTSRCTRSETSLLA